MICKKCGKEIADGSKFCPSCGEKQVDIYKKVFTREGFSEKDFIKSVNEWFAANPKVANVKCRFESGTSIGLLANDYKLKEIQIEYELFGSNNKNQYAITKEETYTLLKKSSSSFIEDWKKSHPEYKVVNWSGGTNSRGKTGTHLLGGFGAANRTTAFILYKFPRK